MRASFAVGATAAARVKPARMFGRACAIAVHLRDTRRIIFCRAAFNGSFRGFKGVAGADETTPVRAATAVDKSEQGRIEMNEKLASPGQWRALLAAPRC